MSTRSTICLLALSLIGALPAVAQTPAAGDEPPALLRGEGPTFGEVLDVRVVNLEVVVSDGRQRVTGLDAEDFRLLVDGEEVPIEYFTEVAGGRAAAAPPGVAGAVPALAPGESVGTRFLVFIDDSFAIPSQRNRVLRRLSEQLPQLGPDDHMAVVAFDGSEIELLSSWTSSQRALERVFRDARERPAYGLQRRAQIRNFLPLRTPFLGRFGDPFTSRTAYGASGGWDGSGAVPAVAPRGSRIYDDLGQVIDAAASSLRAFARPPGRKVMLLLAGGWPVAGENAFRSAVAYGTGRNSLLPLTDTANRLGYTLYPVDIEGIDDRFRDLRDVEHASLREAIDEYRLNRGVVLVKQAGLAYMASETGGRAMYGGAVYGALERAVADTRSYYWLGFSPSWQEDDLRHRVKVEMRQKGLRARTRESFSDLSRQTEVTMLVESSQLFGLPVPGENRHLGVSFGEPAESGARKVVVPLRLEIPLEELTLLPAAGGPVAQLELRVAATDDRGRHAAIPVIPVEARETAEVEGLAVVETALELRRRPHQVLVSLHEPASGALISKRVALTL